jgi:hypothetical protein
VYADGARHAEQKGLTHLNQECVMGENDDDFGVNVFY